MSPYSYTRVFHTREALFLSRGDRGILPLRSLRRDNAQRRLAALLDCPLEARSRPVERQRASPIFFSETPPDF